MGGKPDAGADGWPIKNGVRSWGLFGSSQQAAGVTAARSMPQLEDGVRHGFLSIKDPYFLHAVGGRQKPLGVWASGMCP